MNTTWSQIIIFQDEILIAILALALIALELIQDAATIVRGDADRREWLAVLKKLVLEEKRR